MSLHIAAKNGDVAEKVLLPGDPMRAKYIAENYLESFRCYTDIRGMYGFTGFYHGCRVSVQGTGMGMPSLSIYASELINSYGAKELIRVGTCGAISNDLDLKDVLLVTGASSDSNMVKKRFGYINFAPVADFSLLKKASEIANQKEVKVVAGTVFTSDFFYWDNSEKENKLLESYGIKALDMETAELYILAQKNGVKALSMLSVSDHITSKRFIAPEERVSAFAQMIELALDTIVAA